MHPHHQTRRTHSHPRQTHHTHAPHARPPPHEETGHPTPGHAHPPHARPTRPPSERSTPPRELLLRLSQGPRLSAAREPCPGAARGRQGRRREAAHVTVTTPASAPTSPPGATVTKLGHHHQAILCATAVHTTKLGLTWGSRKEGVDSEAVVGAAQHVSCFMLSDAVAR